MKTIANKYKQAEDEDGKLYYLLMGSLGTSIALMEQLQETPFYKGRLKQKINIAYKAMLEHEQMIGNKQGIAANNLDAPEIWKQQDNCYHYFESWLKLLFNVPTERHGKLNNYIELGEKMYS